MSNRLHRSLTLAAVMAMLLPIGVNAQQSDQQPDKNQSQTQNDDSTAQSPADHPHRGRGMRGMRGMRGGEGMGALAQKLNLTDDQKQQFRQIHQQMMKQARAVHADSSLTADQKRDKMQQLRKQSHQQMFSILTPEQKEQLKQLREQRQKEMQEKNGGKTSGDQASARPATRDASDDDDPFAGMTSDDDGPEGN